MTVYAARRMRTLLSETLPDEFRIAGDTPETLAEYAETYTASVTEQGWQKAREDDRKTIKPDDIYVEQIPSQDALVLPRAQVDRAARADLPEAAMIGEETQLALAQIVEEYLTTIVQNAQLFTEHAGRKTIRPADIDLYFDVFEDLPQ